MDIQGLIKGIHHITATVDGAQEDFDFYTKTLALRLVKETVNFDNEKVYHFYYGNEIGSPSTIFTTFPIGGRGSGKGDRCRAGLPNFFFRAKGNPWFLERPAHQQGRGYYFRHPIRPIHPGIC